eukprot:Colp12_sorted_trinity150504_noHs@12074
MEAINELQVSMPTLSVNEKADAVMSDTDYEETFTGIRLQPAEDENHPGSRRLSLCIVDDIPLPLYGKRKDAKKRKRTTEALAKRRQKDNRRARANAKQKKKQHVLDYSEVTTG